MVRIYPEDASEVFKQFEPVNLTSGKVQRIAATATSVTAGDGVLGWALCAASGTTNTDIPVLIADDLTEWLVPVIHGTAASAVTALTNVGTQYTICHLATSGWYGYEISVTSNPVIEITEVSPEYAVGEQYGWAWGKIIVAARVIA